MNVIIAYLDTMFTPYPQTPRMLEAKTELQAMMEDAYQGFISEGFSHNEAVGRVITDFGNLDELAPVLGIVGEIAPPAAAETRGGAEPAAAATAAAMPPAPRHAPVTMEEARGFADAQQRIRFRVGAAIPLFVLSPVLLVILPTAAETATLPFTPDVAAAIGILAVLVIVAIGVMLIFSTSRDLAPFKRLTEGRFCHTPEVAHWADDLAKQHERSRLRALQIAVLFWILSPAPLLAFALLMEDSPQQNLWVVIGVALVLVFVAAGLALLLPMAWANNVAEKLGTAASDDPEDVDDDERSIVGVIAAFYFPLLVAVYLAWSFIGDAWDRSWIVWPVGAVLFGAIAAGGGAIESYRKGR